MGRRGVFALCVTLMAAGCSGDAGRGTATIEPTTAPGPITLTVELDRTEVSAGETITGFLVFENTGPAVDVLAGGGCTPIWGMALTNADVPEVVEFTVPCGSEPLHIPAGQSQVPITILTTRGGDALPPGVYETALVLADVDDLGGPPPAPVTVTITD